MVYKKNFKFPGSTWDTFIKKIFADTKKRCLEIH